MTEVAKIEETQVAETAPDHMVSMIERVVMDPSLPIERLEKMLDMKERMENREREDAAEESRKAYWSAMAACQKALPLIVHNRTNTFTNSTYADLAAIEKQAMPIIHEYGFSVSAASASGAPEGWQRVKVKIGHEAGHVEEIEDDFPLDGIGSQGKQNKTPLHAKGSTTTYGRRYIVCGQFNIATSDDDGNEGGGTPGATPTAAMGKALDDAWKAGVLDALPDDATDDDKAQAFSRAIIAGFERKGTPKSTEALETEWDRRKALIAGMEKSYPDLWREIVDAYENRVMALAEGNA